MRKNLLTLQLFALANVVVYALFLWQGNKGFSLWDEGFLWYGAQRVMLGEVPIRDFFSYDPGRYYWSAALMKLCGNNGIMALRWSVALFQALGLFVGLLLIARSVKKPDFLYLFLSSLILLVWMYPRHKLFDISLSILLIGALTFLINNPTSRRFFLTGLCVGLVAVFGRNHGIYGVGGSIGVMAWLSIKRVQGPGFVKGFSVWAVGVAGGFAPIVLMALVIPGFALAYWYSISYLFEIKTTNLSLPVPWPWRVPFGLTTPGNAIRGVLVGIFFVATVLWGVLSIAFVVWRKFHKKQVAPAVVASSFLTLPYAHYAYSRADISHLAQGIFPLLVGCLALFASQPAKTKWPLLFLVCSASLWVMHIFHPGWLYHVNNQWVNIEISENTLVVPPSTAKDVILLRKLAEKYAPSERSIVVTPLWPGAYALLEKRSPMWAIYSIFPRSEKLQNEENERIGNADPGFLLVIDTPVDGRDDLRFHNTHPVINHFIETEFQKSDDQPSNPNYFLYTNPF